MTERPVRLGQRRISALAQERVAEGDLRLVRQRPSRVEPTGPLLCPRISREQLELSVSASGLPAITSTAVQVAMAAVVLVPFAMATGAGLPATASEGWSLAYIVLFPSLGSYLLWNLALKRTTAANAGNYLNLIAVFTAIITVALGQPVTVPQVLGGILVITGVLLTSAGSKAPQRPRSSKSTSSPPSASPAEFRRR